MTFYTAEKIIKLISYLIGIFCLCILPSICLGCNPDYERQVFKALFGQLQNYVNEDAQETIQFIISGVNLFDSNQFSCNYECQKGVVYVFGILGFSKLQSQVSGNIRDLLSQFISLDALAVKQYDQVSPYIQDEADAVGCNLLRTKSQLLRQVLSLPISDC